MATYAPVDGSGLAGALAEIPVVRERLGGEPSDWRIREVGDGNLNLVFIVEGPAAGVVVKQALPYVRLVGESWPLPLERSWFEYNALTEEARYAGRLTPEVFHFDRAQAMIVMEYLHPHIIMRKGLIRGIEYPRFADDIAEFLAATLFSTSVLAGTAAEHKARAELFAPNTALCKITEDLVFTDPYREAPLNRWTRPYLDAEKRAFERDSALKVAAQARKYQFMTSAQALIHGDLHTGSIMVTPRGHARHRPRIRLHRADRLRRRRGHRQSPARLFRARGPRGRSPCARSPTATGFSCRRRRSGQGSTAAFSSSGAPRSSGDAYPASLFASDDDRAAMEKERARFMRVLFEDTLAFAGAKMIRRILGLAHVEDLEAIADPERRARCEIKALRLARELLVCPKGFSGVADVVSAARSVGRV